MPPKGTTSVRKHDLVQDVADDSLKGRKHSEKPKADGAVPKQIKVAEKRSHPTTLEMVKEALKALESRKGQSAQAIRRYILEKYPSVDALRLKYMLRKALAKGLENGTLVRPANSSAKGAQGRFRLAPRGKTKDPKGTENSDPNMVKPEVKTKAKVTGSEKPKPVTKKAKIQASGSTEVLASKVAPAKKPKKAAGNKEVTKPKVGTGPRARKVTSSATQLEGEGKAANKRGKTAL
ncbi:hypothetical protein GJAV_G00174940 [Gymnothorax javanicus]|nr:hypothetical protein GJAV_G00174940 [Gymnothorax javanicus]